MGKLEITERVYRYLCRQAPDMLTVAIVAERLKLSEGSTRRALTRLIRQGRAKRSAHPLTGVYFYGVLREEK